MDVSLRDLADSISDVHSLEDLTRTLLKILEAVTGLDSIYLTSIDPERARQEVLFATNRRPEALAIPEGLSVPWENTVCRRALADATPVTTEADRLWGDIEAVRALKIRTYLSEPVRDADGDLLGTLCVVSDRAVPTDPGTLRILGLFARLIAHQFARERQWDRLKKDNEELTARLTVDPLTGIANRRGLMAELDHALSRAARHGGRVAAVFVDLDRFKAINDLYGHKVGDHFLIAVAARLAAVTRRDETVARYGGDEFVVVADLTEPFGRDRETGEAAGAALAARFAEATRGTFRLGEVTIDYAGASAGVAVAAPGEDATALLHRADAAMYAAKRAAGTARDAAEALA